MGYVFKASPTTALGEDLNLEDRLGVDCRGVQCTPAERKQIFPIENRCDRNPRLLRATNVIPLLGEMGVAQKGCRRDKVAPTVLRIGW